MEYSWALPFHFYSCSDSQDDEHSVRSNVYPQKNVMPGTSIQLQGQILLCQHHGVDQSSCALNPPQQFSITVGFLLGKSPAICGGFTDFHYEAPPSLKNGMVEQAEPDNVIWPIYASMMQAKMLRSKTLKHHKPKNMQLVSGKTRIASKFN